MCLLYWGAYGPFRGLVLVLLRYLLALPTRMYFIQLQTRNHPLSIIRQSRHSVFAQVKSLNIQSSRSLFKWSEVSIQRSLQRVNSSPGRKTSNWPLWESMFSSPCVWQNRHWSRWGKSDTWSVSGKWSAASLFSLFSLFLQQSAFNCCSVSTFQVSRWSWFIVTFQRNILLPAPDESNICGLWLLRARLYNKSLEFQSFSHMYKYTRLCKSQNGVFQRSVLWLKEEHSQDQGV